jgi:16S rRNA (cytidine1402-2'-O)-methyltransferase
MNSTVYLIPIAIAEDGYDAVPSYISDKMELCEIFFVENLRTARRAFKKINKTFDIDSRTWYEIAQKETTYLAEFQQAILQGKVIGIASESGCPGIADPGQRLIEIAQQMGAIIKPLSGPSSLLMALMASGMNGQYFSFNGYLPIEHVDRERKIKELEKKCIHDHASQIFIETPYRNNQMLASILKACQPGTRLCIAFNISASNEWIKTKSIKDWKQELLEIPKEPAIFILGT